MSHRLGARQPRAVVSETLNGRLPDGTGAALAGWDGHLVYVDVPKNEIQFRSRAGAVGNIGAGEIAGAKQTYKRFYFVDLPGYGFARAPREVRESWGRLVTDYLAKRDSLVLSIHIVDSRHEPTKLDLQLREWLLANGKPFLTVATKSDKLSQNESHKNLARARKVLDAVGRGAGGELLAYSATTGRGRERVWHAIEEAVAASQSPS